MTTAIIKLLTSDNKVVSVDTAFLSIHSIVFKEMFLLPQSSDNDDSTAHCTISESEKDINLMIEGMKGTVRDYNHEEMKVLIRLGDKYDCPGLFTACRVQLW
jgi:hypothetical protein